MTNGLADMVINKISKHRRYAQQCKQKENTQARLRLRHNRTRGEKQRVARKDRCYHKTRLCKNDKEEYQIRPRFVVANNFDQMLVDVKHKVNEGFEKLNHCLRLSMQITQTFSNQSISSLLFSSPGIPGFF